MKPLFVAFMLATLGAACISTSATVRAQSSGDNPPSVKIATPPGWERSIRKKAKKWRNQPPAEGAWEYTDDAGISSATFGKAGASPRFRISCSIATKRITLARLGMVAAEGMPMTIRTEMLKRRLATYTPDRSVMETLSYVDGGDPILDAMAADRFAVQIDLITIVLPTSLELRRVMEDCR